MLILIGAGIIVYEATRQLVSGAAVERLGVGIAVMGFSVFANLGVSTVLSRQAKAHESPALEGDAAHLRTDALTSAGVLVGLALVQVTGNAAFDSITALVVAAAIVSPGSGSSAAPPASSSTKRCPRPRWTGSRRRSPPPARRRSPATTSCAPAAPAAAATSTSTSSTAPAPASSAPTSWRTEMRDSIEAEIPNAEVLIHVEPETSLRELGRSGPFRAG